MSLQPTIWINSDGCNTYLTSEAYRWGTKHGKLSAIIEHLRKNANSVKKDLLYGAFQIYEIEGDNAILRAAQSTEKGALKYMGENRVLLIVQ